MESALKERAARSRGQLAAGEMASRPPAVAALTVTPRCRVPLATEKKVTVKINGKKEKVVVRNVQLPSELADETHLQRTHLESADLDISPSEQRPLSVEIIRGTVGTCVGNEL